MVFKLVLLLALIVILTLPFGYWRASVERLSRNWFLAIHIPVPIVIILRLLFGFGWWALILTVPAFAIGHYIGGRSRALIAKQA